MKEGFPAFREAEFLGLLESLARARGLPGREGERQAVLAGFLAGKGVRSEPDAAGNLWVTVREGAWEDSVILDAHVDTVHPGRADRVFRQGSRLIGAGISDNLAQVAMLAIFSVSAREFPGRLETPLRLLFSVGEEGLGNLRGVRRMLRDHPSPPALFISWEGGPERFSFDALGSRRFRLRVTAPGGHSWSDFGTPSAIGEMLSLLEGCRAARRRAAGKADRDPSFNIGRISGGEGINCIARKAEATFEFRSVSEEKLAALEAVARSLAADRECPEVSVELKLVGARPAASAPGGPPGLAGKMSLAWGREKIPLRAAIRSTNINAPLAAGWPCACLGLCRGGRGHHPDSWLDLDSLPVAWRLLNGLVEILP